MRMVEVDDGVRLRTWTSGTETDLPAVVLLHGGPGLWDYLEPVARMLDPLTVVHRFDHRGCGGSDPAPEHTFARYLADIEALRRHWGHERWIVLGHSFGAILAFTYAVAHPDRTLAMGYVSGLGVGDWRSAYRREKARRMSAEQQQRLAALDAQADRSPAEEIEFRTLSWFTDHADPGDGWRWATADASVGMTVNVAANRTLMAETRRWPDEQVLADAGRLTMPCWFVHGDRDPRPLPNIEALAGAVPGSEFHLVRGAGHQPWRECPAAFQELLRGLVSSRGKTGDGGAPLPS